MNQSEFSPRLLFDLGEVYEENVERARFMLNFYRILYDLPTFEYNNTVTPELFEYCKRRLFFVNILAIQRDRVFLNRALSETLGWQLPGSAVRSKGTELFEDAVSRILTRDIPAVEMAEMRPFAHLKKTYHYGGDDVTHHGLIFMGRVRSPSPQEIERNEDIKGRFVMIADGRETDRLSAFEKQLVSLGSTLLVDRLSDHFKSLDLEITSTEQISSQAQWLHNTLVRPIGRRFSSRIIKNRVVFDKSVVG